MQLNMTDDIYGCKMALAPDEVLQAIISAKINKIHKTNMNNNNNDLNNES